MQNIVTPVALQQSASFVREGLVTFNPAQANTVLRECRYERQRDETRAKTHINALAEQMRRGLWLPKTQIDFARTPDGKLILANGHHRMHAQIAAAVNILWNIVIHDCRDDAEVAALYWKFDTTLRKRSSSNILEGIGFAEGIGVSRATARALWGAVPILNLGLKMYRYQTAETVGALLPDDRQQIAAEYASEASIAESLLRLAPAVVRKRMLVASRFAIMIAILRHQPERGANFWRGFCEDDGLAKGDPRKTLLQDMQVRPNKAGLQAQHMMAIARAWNAYFEGRPTTVLKVTGSAVPVAGTPLTVQA